MQVQFTCECGQVMWADIGPGGGAVQCPACGKLLNVAGTAAAPYGPAGYAPAGPPTTASGKAIAALVFGLCSFIPGLGVLCAPVAIGLGIAALVKKLDGKGMSIAGIITGVCALGVQALIGLWVYWMVMAVTSFTSRAFSTLSTMPTVKATANGLDANQIDTSLHVSVVVPLSAERAEAELKRARQLYRDRDAQPGNRYRCLEAYARHLGHKGGDFEDPQDAANVREVRQELAGKIGAKLKEAERLQLNAQWKKAENAYAEAMELVPDANNLIHLSAEGSRQSYRMIREVSGGDGEP